MRREFKPWFAVVNEDYHQGSSGGGTTPGWADPDESYCGKDGWIYTYCEDNMDGLVIGFEEPAWYRYKGDLEFDESGWHESDPPTGTPACPF